MIEIFLHAYRLMDGVMNAQSGKQKPGSNRFQYRGQTYASFFLPPLAIIISAVQASADTYQLICENPRREYTVSFSDGDKNIQLGAPEGTTLYRVLAVEQTPERHVVVALTIDDGPTVRLSLRPYLRMEYWSGNELFQTDACRNP
jgi:hypothetical protein